MLIEANHRGELKQELIQKVGPWAFQSYPKSRWKDLSDKEVIKGALLNAKPEDRLMLLQIYNMDQIKDVWEKYVAIQDDFFHSSNVWAAQFLFNESNPEKFVRRQVRKIRKHFLAGQLA